MNKQIYTNTDNTDLDNKNSETYLYKFSQVNNEEDIKLLFKEVNKDIEKSFKFLAIAFILETLVTIFLYSIFVLILTIIGFCLMMFMLIVICINNSSQKKQLKTNHNGSTEDIELYDDHFIYFYKSIDKDLKLTFKYSDFKMFKESNDILLLYANNNQIFGFYKKYINNLEIESFIKSKMYENVKTFNGKSIKK